jgi:cell division protein FtsW
MGVAVHGHNHAARIVLPFTSIHRAAHQRLAGFLFGGSIQPSEIGKLAVIMWTSMLLVKKGDQMRRLTKGLLPFLIVIGVLDILVVLEPDLSVAMMYTLVMGIILFAGGVRVGHFVALGILAIPVFWHEMEKLQYVMLRMSTFLDPGKAPDVSYQLKQSPIAAGVGWRIRARFECQQLGFVPFGYNDSSRATSARNGARWPSLLTVAFDGPAGPDAPVSAVSFPAARRAS